MLNTQNLNASFEILLNFSPDAIALVRQQDGHIVKFNNKLSILLGYAENLTLEQVNELTALKKIFLFDNEVNNQNDNFEYETKLTAINGELIPVKVIAKSTNTIDELHFIFFIQDLSIISRLKDEIESIEDRYKTLFESNDDSILVSYLYEDKTTSNFIEFNKNAIKLLGYEKNELYEISYNNIFFNSEKEDKNISGNELISKGEMIIETSVIDKNGKNIDVELKTRSIYYNGKPAIMYIIRDISAMKISEEFKYEYLSRLEMAMEAASMAWWDMNLKTGEVLFNKRKTDILGYDYKDFKHYNDFMKLVHPEDYEKAMEAMRDHLYRKKDKYETEYRILAKSGEYKWFYDIGAIVKRDIDGKPLKAIGLVIDITDRKNSEEALRVSEEKFSKAFQNSPDIILIESLNDGKILDVNSNITQITGYLKEEIIEANNNEFDLWNNPVEKTKYLNEISLNDRVVGFEAEFKKKLGEIFHSIISGETFVMNGIKYSLNIIHDITERKQAEIKLKKYADELKELNNTKDKFFSIIAHDLRSPFHALLGITEILADQENELSEADKNDFINNLYSLTKNIYKLIENLLEWSRIQTGKMTFQPVNFNLLSEIEPTLNLLSQTAQNKKIDFVYNIMNNITVYADKNMLSTIIRNIVSNSIKFTKPGGMITLTAVQLGDNVNFYIKDTGIGMEPETVKKLFTTEKHKSAVGTANEKGTGLGLLLCKEMIDKHSGEITVESEIGKGSKFTFKLPLDNQNKSNNN